jgi:hypothetical protein
MDSNRPIKPGCFGAGAGCAEAAKGRLQIVIGTGRAEQATTRAAEGALDNSLIIGLGHHVCREAGHCLIADTNP